MADDADLSDERIQRERDEHIAHARRAIPLHERPVLGCEPCSGITQADAKKTCAHYAVCLADWQRDETILNKQKGK